jgi:hypothetical protein
MVLAGWQEISKEEYNMYFDEEIAEELSQITATNANPLELINGDPSEGLES